MPDTDNPLIASLIEAEQIARGERQPAKIHTVYVNSSYRNSVMFELPKGVVAVITGTDGRVIAHAADFEDSSTAGLTQAEIQKIRARRALADKLVDNACAPYIAETLHGYDAEQLMEKLRRHYGFTVEYIEVGQDRSTSGDHHA